VSVTDGRPGTWSRDEAESTPMKARRDAVSGKDASLKRTYSKRRRFPPMQQGPLPGKEALTLIRAQ